MVDKRQLEELTAWVRSQGGDVLTVTGKASIYDDGSPCFQVVNLPGCGPHPMGAIGFAERIRELRAKTLPWFDVWGYPDADSTTPEFEGAFCAPDARTAIIYARRSGCKSLDLYAEPQKKN